VIIAETWSDSKSNLAGKIESDSIFRRVMDIMRFGQVLFVLCAIAAFVTPATAGETDKSVKVANAWVRAPAPGQKTASVYLDVTSDRDAVLVAAGSPAASRVEMHSTSVEGGVMRMRALSRLELKAGQTVKLAPGGTHFMLVGAKPMKAGDKVPLTLSIQSTGAPVATVTLEAEVRAADGSAHRH